MDSRAKRIAWIEEQRRLGVNICRAGDAGNDLAADALDRSFEDAADDALLPPDLPFAQLAVRKEAGELGARARAARRAVVGFAGAEDEVAAVIGRITRRTVELDVVDLCSLGAGYRVALERSPNAPSEVGELFHVADVERVVVLGDEEEPIAAPGDVAGDRAGAFHFDRHVGAMPIT